MNYIIYHFLFLSHRTDEIVWYLSLTKYNSFRTSFKAENFGSRFETGLRRRTNEAGERMKPEVVAVKCARGPVVYLYPCRLVSVGVDVARLNLDPESRVAFPPLVPRRFPYQLYPPSLSFTEGPLCFFLSHLVSASHCASSRDGAHRLARIKYSQEF